MIIHLIYKEIWHFYRAKVSIYKIALFFLGRMREKERRSYDDCQKINALKEPSEILAYDYNA